MKQLRDLHTIEKGGLPYYKWKAAYLTRRTVEYLHMQLGQIQIALCLLLVSLGVLKK
jgi:hypothetical protein